MATSSSNPTWLVYGCRNRNQDYLFQNEWTDICPLSDFDVCFSREESDEKYVQDILKRKAEKTAKMVLQDGAKIFVCGSNVMAKDVNETIIQILHKNGELSESQAKEKVADMRIQDDYLQEIWS